MFIENNLWEPHKFIWLINWTLKSAANTKNKWLNLICTNFTVIQIKSSQHYSKSSFDATTENISLKWSTVNVKVFRHLMKFLSFSPLEFIHPYLSMTLTHVSKKSVRPHRLYFIYSTFSSPSSCLGHDSL